MTLDFKTELIRANEISVAGMKAGVQIGRDESSARLAAAEKAIRACHAWHVAEHNSIGSFDARMELCNYSEWLVARWLGLAPAEYIGVPRMTLFPVEINRCTEENAEELVAAAFEFMRTSNTESEAIHD